MVTRNSRASHMGGYREYKVSISQRSLGTAGYAPYWEPSPLRPLSLGPFQV